MSSSTSSISRWMTNSSTLDQDMVRRNAQLERLLDKELRKSNQLFMDRLLNYKLDRDNLPEDTPLPIYLAHREPRSLSPPSRWDA
ncbi:uncharacterized protein LOC27208979 [Drosophila simulans]|uniref:Uncharacterized protein n=1 Tax=Drosophila simulans TaxID=7240 RepID=A0A0J9UFL5_DROSI|nr:uncharacterized protein LOC27208979 [Drosophila simulans]KMY97915.1 uncharacterized protein Dsimw501_GD29136 [Drosophila simulans]